MKSLQLQSCVHENNTIECALFEVDIPEPGPDEVLIKVEAAPINPSDLGLMFGILDTATATASERNGFPAVTLPVPEAMMRAMKAVVERNEVEYRIGEVSRMVDSMVLIAAIMLPVICAHNSPSGIEVRNENKQQGIFPIVE